MPPIRVSCPNPECRASYSVDDSSLGRLASCRKCGRRFELNSTIGGDEPYLEPIDDARLPSELSIGASSPIATGSIGSSASVAWGPSTLAQDVRLSRSVALKVPHFRPDESPEILRRFEREARALAGLDHPNLCRVHDVGEFLGVHFLTMQYIEGAAAEPLLRDGPIDPLRAVEVVRELAIPLVEAHDSGVVPPDHEDLERDRQPSAQPGHRRLWARPGGPRRRLPAHPHRSDARRPPPTWPRSRLTATLGSSAPRPTFTRIGVILFELLTGRLPFQGSVASVLVQIKTEHPFVLARSDRASTAGSSRSASKRWPSSRNTDTDRCLNWSRHSIPALGAPPSVPARHPRYFPGDSALSASPPIPRRKPRVAILAGLALAVSTLAALGFYVANRPENDDPKLTRLSRTCPASTRSRPNPNRFLRKRPRKPRKRTQNHSRPNQNRPRPKRNRPRPNRRCQRTKPEPPATKNGATATKSEMPADEPEPAPAVAEAPIVPSPTSSKLPFDPGARNRQGERQDAAFGSD